MSNSFYNPYDSGIQWGDGIADFVEQNRDMLMSIFGGGGSKRVKGITPTGSQAMGQPNMGPIGAGGGGMGNQDQLMGDIMGGGGPMGMMGSPGGGSPSMNFQGGSPAQFGSQQNAPGAPRRPQMGGGGGGIGSTISHAGASAGMTPEMEQMVAQLMQALAQAGLG